VSPERIVVVSRHRVGDPMTRPPAADRAGKAANHQPDRPAERTDRHPTGRAYQSTRALAERLRVAVHSRATALARWPAFGLRE
jgi:hypothetical protein